ncbi:MAG: DUF2961 domain-containing protein [Planctomycetota bacterium]|nr:MAG: DUF2961 domain-containing protein [Planctomycetota bacterium]
MMKSVWLSFVIALLVQAGVGGAGLENLATVVDRTSHRASSYDRAGGNIDIISSFAPRASEVLLDTDGPGKITHVWFTFTPFPGNKTALRDLVIRMYWEHSSVPSVEVPLGDFFALGHNKYYTVHSIPVAVGDNRKALNCYWPMPFYKHARIELYNNGRRSIRRIYYHIDYELGSIAADQGLFHAEFRRDKELRTQARHGNVTGEDNYVILETEGRGHYVGCALFIDAQAGGWWGEGDDMIFIDHSERPVIIGTGSEDYFCNAWGYRSAFSYPFYGAPLLEKRPDKGSFTTVYRWHIHDPVRFKKHIRVTIEHLFHPKVVNDYSSVAFWYQMEPIKGRRPLPYAEDNHPRNYEKEPPRPSTFELDGTELEPELQSQGIAARAITAELHDGYKNGGWLRVRTGERGKVEMKIPVPEEGNYRVQLKPVNHIIEGFIEVGLKGSELRRIEKREFSEHKVPYVNLGKVNSKDKKLIIVVGGNSAVGIDHLKVEKVD